MANQLREIKGVEIFAAGTWNGDTYTEKDLDAMVSAFRETSSFFKPYLKLGHNDEQQLIQNDGLPAAGWIGSIYRIGEKLMADFVDIPQKIFELIENKAYRKVSSEIYWNINIKETKYPYLLGAVALLGADTPAVSTLNDILSLFGLKDFDKIKIYANEEKSTIVKQYSFKPDDQGDKNMKTEAELKLELELQAEKEKRAKLEADAKEYALNRADIDAELKKLREEKAESDKKAADALLKAEEARKEGYAAALVAKKVITPAMKPYVLAFIGEDKKEYSFEKDEKLSKEALLEKILKLHTAADVNTDEGSEAGQERKEGNSDDVLNEKIEKYMEENKCSYKMAYKAITAEHKPRESVAMGMAAVND